MVASSPIANDRPRHRTPRAGPDAIDNCFALDWANGQVVAIGAASAAGAAFDGGNDRLVMVSVSSNAWITVGPVGTVTAGKGTAGNMFLSASSPPIPVYIPAGFTIAVIEDAAVAGTLSAIPALIAL